VPSRASLLTGMRGTSEGAVLEELYCGAGNEGRRRHRAESVERLRGECFARAAFPSDRCNAQMARGAANLRKEPLHDRAAPDHGAQRPLGMIGNYMRRGRSGGRQFFFDALW
jgi:hypothetical protein